MLAEQDLLLVRQMFRIGVDRDVVSPRRLGEAGCSGLDVVQQAVQEIDLALPVHRRLLVLRAGGRTSWGEIRMAFGALCGGRQFRPGLCTKLVVLIRYRISRCRGVNTAPYQDLLRRE